ncbi:MAG: bacteriohemerythrin [Rhodoferax sp.]|nr:bacteriohemerythrin [Rhodoferax sp.]
MSRLPRILVVDDNPNNRLALRTILKGVDAQIHEAANGLDALSMVVEDDYALILLDVQMPEMDGYEVCDHLRSDLKTANTPVIFLTAAFKDDVDKVRGYVAGATDYLAKPIDDHILRSKVTVFLKLYTQSQLLKENESRIRAILDNALDAVVGINADGQIERWNRRAQTIFGWTEGEALGQAIDEMIVPQQHREAHRQGLAHFLATKQERVLNRRVEITAVRRSGEEFPIELAITPFEVGNTHHFTAFIADISLRKAAEERVGFLANHDRLTDLPNRELFFDRLSQAISLSRRKRSHLAVLFLDLDGFKKVNDTHGHEVGDATLRTVARRLKASVRAMDSVARLGGDEFAVLLGDIQEPADITVIADKIIKTIAETMYLSNGEPYCIGVSIGVAIYPENGAEIDTLMKRADNAMYQSKARGKNQSTFFGQFASEMTPFSQWVYLADSHRLGIEVIDEQHHKIATMLNRLNSSLKNNESQDNVALLLDELVTYTVFHFETEERLMAEHNYPDADGHNAAHRHLTKEVRYLTQRLEQGGELLLLQWLKDWFLAHVTSSDMALGAYLHLRGVK